MPPPCLLTQLRVKTHVAQLQLPLPIGCGSKMNAEGKHIVDWIVDAMPQQLVEAMSQTA